MKTSRELLSNYRTSEGLEFKLLDDEKILVDSFQFISGATYVAFLTNKRFIFRKPEGRAGVYLSLSTQSAEGWMEGFHADMKFAWLEDLSYIKINIKGGVNSSFVIKGKIVDFTEEALETETLYGAFAAGLGGLSYGWNNKQVEHDLIHTLSPLCKEKGIQLETSRRYEEFDTSDSHTSQSVWKETAGKEWKDTSTYIFLLLTLLTGILGYTWMANTPKYQPEPVSQESVQTPSVPDQTQLPPLPPVSTIPGSGYGDIVVVNPTGYCYLYHNGKTLFDGNCKASGLDPQTGLATYTEERSRFVITTSQGGSISYDDKFRDNDGYWIDNLKATTFSRTSSCIATDDGNTQFCYDTRTR